MYKRILMPVDGSDVSNHAAEEGMMLAKALGADITFLYVVDTSIVAMPDAELALSNMEVVRRSFQEQGGKILKHLVTSAGEKGISAEEMMAEGDVHDEIIRVAEEKKADVIVMGTHGRRGLNRLLLGSVADSVTKRARCAVLLIRPR